MGFDEKFVNFDNEGNVKIVPRDRLDAPIDSLFSQSISNFTISVATTASTVTTLEYDFTATAGHGIAIGNEIILLDTIASKSFIAEVTNVVANVITVDRPIDHAFPLTTLGRIITSELAVDGSATPQMFSVRAGSIPSDFRRFILTFLTSNVPAANDALFGNLPALANGLVFRIVNDFQKTIFNFKSNRDIQQFCYDFRYNPSPPAASQGMTARISFGGQEKHGMVLRLKDNDVLQWIVQDDLTGLTSLKIAAQGNENNIN